MLQCMQNTAVTGRAADNNVLTYFQCKRKSGWICEGSHPQNQHRYNTVVHFTDNKFNVSHPICRILFDLQTTGVSKEWNLIIERAGEILDHHEKSIKDASFLPFIKPLCSITSFIPEITGIDDEECMKGLFYIFCNWEQETLGRKSFIVKWQYSFCWSLKKTQGQRVWQSS